VRRPRLRRPSTPQTRKVLFSTGWAGRAQFMAGPRGSAGDTNMRRREPHTAVAGRTAAKVARALIPPMTPGLVLRAILGMLLFLCGLALGIWLIIRFRRLDREHSPPDAPRLRPCCWNGVDQPCLPQRSGRRRRGSPPPTRPAVPEGEPRHLVFLDKLTLSRDLGVLRGTCPEGPALDDRRYLASRAAAGREDRSRWSISCASDRSRSACPGVHPRPDRRP
jgi:hypothetical protein